MDGSADSVAAEAPPASLAPEELARALGVNLDTAERLVKGGYLTADAARGLSAEALIGLGISTEQASRVRGAPAGDVDSDKIVERWAGTVRRGDRGRRKRPAVAPKESTEVLRKWVDGDDRVMEDWIRSSEADRPVAAVPSIPVPTPVPEVVGPAAPVSAETKAVAPVLEREETVVRWLTGLLDRVKSDQFDPSTMIQEVQDLQRQLFDERTKRKQLEDEVEHVKRGSIAVIKYVRSREAKDREIAVRAKDDEIAELKLRLLAIEGVEGRKAPAAPGASVGAEAAAGPMVAADAVEKATRELDQRLREEFSQREHEFIERETELRRRIVQLEGDVRRLSSQTELARDRESLLAKEHGTATQELGHRLESVEQREKDLVGRENELRTRFEEIRLNAEENERRRGVLEFKEGELAAYDTQLQTRRQALDIEARRLEELRREVASAGPSPGDQERRLEDLKHQLSQKEVELKAREGQLRERVLELERMTAQAAEGEAAKMHAEAVRTVAEAKVKSGVRRLDDLLYGGFPIGSQILVNGPAHTGKDVLARLFSAEGLRLGIPSIWVVTDKTFQQVRDDLAGLYPGFAEAEKKGMIRYADLYSRSVGATPASPGVRFLSSTDKNLLDQLAETVNSYAEELKEKFTTYRLIFESVSTVTAYLDTASTFRFLQPFVGRRKIDGAVGYFVLDSGMHSESDLETLEHMVDGSINLKIEQMKPMLAIRGLGEAQARTWVGYTFTKRSFNLGSFSLEHIR